MIRPFLLACVALLATSLTGAAQTVAPDTPVAAVGGYAVTQGELEQAFASRGRNFGSDLETARARLRDMVIAEHWVDQNYAELVADNPMVSSALGEARRQVLFELYAQSSFAPPSPSDADVAAYVAARPHQFGERKVYRFQRIQIFPRSPEERATLNSVLDTALNGPLTESTFAAVTGALRDTGIPFTEARAWAGSEELSEPVRETLLSMALADRDIDRTEGPEGSVTVVLLLDARTEPVDPALLDGAIRNRIVQEAYQAHRTALATSIAEPLLGAVPDAAPTGPAPQGFLIGIGGIGLLLGLSLIAQLSWMNRVRDHLVKARRDHLDEDMTALRKPGLVTGLALLLALGSVAGGVGLLRFLNLSLLSVEALGAFFGLLILGLVLGALLWRGNKDSLEKSRSALVWAERRGVLLPLLLIGGAGAVIAVPDLAGQVRAVLSGLL